MMVANLYLHADALVYNGTDDEHAFRQKFSSLLSDLSDIRNQYGDDNIIKISPSLYDGSVCLFEQQSVFDVVSSLDYEEKNFFFSLIGNESVLCELPLEKINELSIYQKEELECHTVVYLNKPIPPEPTYPQEYMSFDRYEIVYGKDSWVTVRRQIMGNHPGTAHSFMEQCKIYFPNIVFHSNCEVSIAPYLDSIPRKIVYYLSCMNDHFLDQIAATNITDENVFLADFCGRYRFDEAGSRQSTPQKKKAYQFDFLKANHEDKPCNYKTITCDPHMKIKGCDGNCKKNDPGLVARIYFHYGDKDIAEGKLLVGSIGPHVD